MGDASATATSAMKSNALTFSLYSLDFSMVFGMQARQLVWNRFSLALKSNW